jgi:cysteine desulfurase
MPAEVNISATSSPIYLDYAATTPMDPRVEEEMIPYLRRRFGDPVSSNHCFGWDAAEAVEEARSHVAELINANPGEIVFTSCATESINFALKGLVQGRAHERPNILSCGIEHRAVLQTCRQVESLKGVQVRLLSVDRIGNIDLDE